MNADDRAWYANRRVLLTGHTGFKGAWLSLWLQEMGAVVQGYALAPLKPSLFELAGVGEGMGSTIGDIRDRTSLRRVVSEFEPEVVIHMAAQSLVRASYDDPVATFDANVMGTVNVLDVLRTAPSVKSAVIVTSDKCYENVGASRPFREEDPMGGSDPYSSSKGCTELVTTSFVRSFFSEGDTVVGSARAGNVVGGGDWGADRLVPDLMRAVAKAERTHIRRPDAVRPWQFVLEPLRGYLVLARQIAEHGRKYAGAWNFGPNHADMVSVRDLVARMQTIWPALSVEFASEIQGPHEAEVLRLDCSKAQNLLGWRPGLDIRQTAEMTVDWYRRVHEQPGSARQVTLDQLRQYDKRFNEDIRGSLQ
jgi:CDP-glucose 4,6-dehydratase